MHRIVEERITGGVHSPSAAVAAPSTTFRRLRHGTYTVHAAAQRQPRQVQSPLYPIPSSCAAIGCTKAGRRVLLLLQHRPVLSAVRNFVPATCRATLWGASPLILACAKKPPTPQIPALQDTPSRTSPRDGAQQALQKGGSQVGHQHSHNSSALKGSRTATTRHRSFPSQHARDFQ